MFLPLNNIFGIWSEIKINVFEITTVSVLYELKFVLVEEQITGSLPLVNYN